MNDDNFEGGGNWNYPPEGNPHDNNSPYGDPFEPNGGRPPYQRPPYQQPPYQPPVQPSIPTKGKGFAIAAFALAVAAFIFFLSGVYVLIELGAAELLADELSNSTTLYYVEDAEVLKLSAKVLFVMSIIPALVSIVLVIFAYDRHYQNVRNGVRAKFVLVFAIIATVLAAVSLLISLILVFK